MGTIVMDGDAKVAPVYLPIRGGAVAWSGKSSDQMSLADFNAISLFCKDEAWEMGYEDGLEGRAKRNNPFHIAFLEGNPHAMFSGIGSRCLSRTDHLSGQRFFCGVTGVALITPALFRRFLAGNPCGAVSRRFTVVIAIPAVPTFPNGALSPRQGRVAPQIFYEVQHETTDTSYPAQHLS